MSAIADLLERVETATEFDREIDYLIEEATNPALKGMSRSFNGGWWPDHIDSEDWIAAPPFYSSSIDAAVALVEKMLPGWWVHGLGRSPVHGLWWCDLYSISEKRGSGVEERDTAPLAILAALLRALPSPVHPQEG